ncbi:hypothetical protein TNCT_691001 [Trichonephila clavata]|uniref:Uncharacterized protein n=1 Tax=Trichonephila clavata TaxID=2740835 RepID=A0A8X6FFP7_TRICU|nr:hypothetical protein TNCT_691001 [Trichonephila clavata]
MLRSQGFFREMPPDQGGGRLHRWRIASCKLIAGSRCTYPIGCSPIRRSSAGRLNNSWRPLVSGNCRSPGPRHQENRQQYRYN